MCILFKVLLLSIIYGPFIGASVTPIKLFKQMERCNNTKMYGEVQVQLHAFLTFSTRWRWLVSFLLWLISPWGKSHHSPLDRSLGGLTASLCTDRTIRASSNTSDSCNKTLHLLPHISSASPCPVPSWVE